MDISRGFLNSDLTSLLIVLKNRKEVEMLQPNYPMLAALKKFRGMIVTAQDTEFDFVSRGFFPAYGIDEDPVTGSAHCCLGPYWGRRLNMKTMRAFQASPRGGRMTVRLEDDRVFLTGNAVTVMEGRLLLR